MLFGFTMNNIELKDLDLDPFISTCTAVYALIPLHLYWYIRVLCITGLSFSMLVLFSCLFITCSFGCRRRREKWLLLHLERTSLGLARLTLPWRTWDIYLWHEHNHSAEFCSSAGAVGYGVDSSSMTLGVHHMFRWASKCLDLCLFPCTKSFP